jgi:D-sedoheptulose 7-phosphate isomerase
MTESQSENVSLRAGQFLSDMATVMSEIEATDSAGGSLVLDTALVEFARLLSSTQDSGGQTFIIGNGGSAAIASHSALDLWKNGDVKAVALNDLAQLTAISNDFGYDQVFAKPLERFMSHGDLLIAISSSGRSPSILNCPPIAKSSGCTVITFSGFADNNPLRSLGDLNFYVPSDRYGIVESTHQSVLHGIIEELIALKEETPTDG